MAAKGTETIVIKTSGSFDNIKLLKLTVFIVILAVIAWLLYKFFSKKRGNNTGKPSLFGSLMGGGSGRGQEHPAGDPNYSGPGYDQDYDWQSLHSSSNYTGPGTGQQLTPQEQAGQAYQGTDPDGGYLTNYQLAQLGIYPRTDGQEGYQYTDRSGQTWYGTPDLLLNM